MKCRFCYGKLGEQRYGQNGDFCTTICRRNENQIRSLTSKRDRLRIVNGSLEEFKTPAPAPVVKDVYVAPIQVATDVSTASTTSPEAHSEIVSAPVEPRVVKTVETSPLDVMAYLLGTTPPDPTHDIGKVDW